MMVPNSMRGRVMGFYGMTWSIMPLGGMQAGWIANYLGAPIAVMIGGIAVAGFAVGPAMLNKQVRNISALVNQVEQAVSAGRQQAQRQQARGGLIARPQIRISDFKKYEHLGDTR